MLQKEFLGERLRQFLEGNECCVACGNESIDLGSLFKRMDVLCHRCRRDVLPVERTVIVQQDGVTLRVHFLYLYQETLGSYLYQLKGIGDVRLAPLFLSPVLRKWKKKYREYTILRMPSWHEDDARRGFNHVEELFAGIGKEILCPLIKIKNEKQASKHKNERKDIGKAIVLDPAVAIGCSKILMVDDVMTTGSTMLHAANLLKLSDVDVLVVALHEALSK